MEKKKKFIIDVIFYLLIAGAIWMAGRYLLPVLAPFILAFLIAGIIQIPVRRMAGDSNRKKRFLSIFLRFFYMERFSFSHLVWEQSL